MHNKIFYVCFISLAIFVLCSLYFHFKVNKKFFEMFLKFDIVRDYKEYKNNMLANKKKPYLFYLANTSIILFIISLIFLFCKKL